MASSDEERVWAQLSAGAPTLETYEPTASARGMAATVFDQYAAFCRAGFSRADALALLGQMLASAVFAHAHDDPDDGSGKGT